MPSFYLVSDKNFGSATGILPKAKDHSRRVVGQIHAQLLAASMILRKRPKAARPIDNKIKKLRAPEKINLRLTKWVLASCSHGRNCRRAP